MEAGSLDIAVSEAFRAWPAQLAALALWQLLWRHRNNAGELAWWRRGVCVLSALGDVTGVAF